MHSSVKKWGNSASIRIPSAIMEAAHLKLDQEVEISEDMGRIIIAPIVSNRFDLSQLLNGITSDNLHSEADFGAPQGRESL